MERERMFIDYRFSWLCTCDGDDDDDDDDDDDGASLNLEYLVAYSN